MTTHERLIELVPDIRVFVSNPHIKRDGRWDTRDITLADVLIALGKIGAPVEFDLYDQTFGLSILTPEEYYKRAMWSLPLPFHLQSQETQDFIGRIIGAEV